jgi:hypothetical protein
MPSSSPILGRRPWTLLVLLILVVVGVGAQHERLLEGLAPRERAVMESVIESMDMRKRVDGEIEGLKLELEKELDQVSPRGERRRERRGDGELRGEAASSYRKATELVGLLSSPHVALIWSENLGFSP